MQKEHVILMADYGRSGQGWLSYMLCYILNAKYIEPYDFLKGRLYTASEHIIKHTQGNLPGRGKTAYSMVIKTHEYPASDFKLTDKVIVLTRDPRDVAVSAHHRYRLISQRKKARSLKDALSLLIHKFKTTSYLMTARKWKKYYEAWNKVPHYRVTYEDLLTDTKTTLQKILAYLGVKTDERIVEKAVELFSFEQITGRKRGEEDKQNPEFRKGVIGDYKNSFSWFQLVLFKIFCGGGAKRQGYEL